ncbi:MAG: O-antigen ligase family protein [Betaproteobacteria bacterium]|nr:O-antigen ligase family protein [Betaproteobacteria bacterium]
MQTATTLPQPQTIFADRLVAVAGAVFLFSLPFTSTIALRLTALAVALAAVAWSDLQQGGASAQTRPPARLVLPLLAWASVCVASWTWSIDPRYTASELKSEVLYPALAFFTFYAGARDAGHWRLWVGAVLASLFVLGVAAPVEQLLWGTFTAERLHADLGFYSTYLVLVFPFLLLLLLPATALTAWLGRLRPAVFCCGFLALVGSGALTANRILWPALAVTLAVFSVLSLPRLPVSAVQRRFLALTLSAVLLGLVLAFGAVASYKARTSYPQASGIHSSLTQDDRLKVWRLAVEKIRADPWLGSGFGRGIHRREMQATLGNPLLWHGHNLGINYLLELGVLGLGALTWLFAAVIREHVRLYRSAEPEARLLGIVGLSLCAGFLVKNMTDDFMVRHTGLLFWALSAMLISYGRRCRRQGG